MLSKKNSCRSASFVERRPVRFMNVAKAMNFLGVIVHSISGLWMISSICAADIFLTFSAFSRRAAAAAGSALI